MRIFIVLACLIVFGSAAQAENFDPFRPNQSNQNSAKKNQDYDPNIAQHGRQDTPAQKSSSLMNMKLSQYDQELFDNCRAEARKYGTDIMRINTSSAFLTTTYRNPSCNKFVVEKMLNSMDDAMRDDPEALVEFQRSKEAQQKYNELKKAYTILSRGNPVAYNNSGFKINNDYLPSGNYRQTPSTRALSAPDSFSDDQYSYIPESKPVVPQEWWAKDYYQADMAKVQAQIANRQEHRNRALSPEGQGLGPNPLKSIMMEAEQKEQDRVSSRHGGARLPSFQNQDSYQ
ncbi:MAG: hypothetical protein EYC62_02165 [Alphaproteobacteria bacterium]|nr:MAG: hypothetical protein EYC62_02165 [Alphaproteobacteria bacterium]